MLDFLITLLSLSALGSVLAAVLFLLKPLLKNKISKACSYYLWIIVLLRLCLPPGISLTVPAGWFAGPSEITETQLIYDTNTGGFIGNQTGKIEPGPLENTQGAAVGTPGLSGGVAVSPEIGGKYTTSTGGTVQTIGAWLGNPAFWFMIWAFGALLSLIWHVFGYIRFAGMLRRSAEAPDAAELTVFREFSGSGRVRLVRSGFVKTPMLLGLLRPVIILPPVSYIRSGGADDLRDILRHELIHYRRRDLLYKWFAMLVTCLHWFNPLTYLVRREIDRACELACDEAVISSLTPAQKQHYGATLMSLAVKEAYPPGILATTMCEDKARLKERLVAIMNHRTRTWTAVLISLALLAGLLGCASINGVGKAEHVTPGAATPDISPVTAETGDATLYEKYGLTVAIPNEYIDKLIIMTESEWEYPEDTTLISVYEKQSYEECRAEYGEDVYAGYIFSIARYTQAQYEQFLASDGSGQSFFAKDDTYYYGWFVPTDVQYYRSGGEISIESEDWKAWEALNEKCREINADFVARNHLTPYSDSEFWEKEYTYDGAHLNLTYYPYKNNRATAATQGFTREERPYTLILSQPAGRGDGGVWCVERWFDSNGNIYYEFPYESGEAAADYYAALQKTADSGGDTTLCDPVKTALAFARSRLGHASATEESFQRIEGEVAGNVWRLCRQVYDDMGTLQAATSDGAGNSADREALSVPEELTPFGSYASHSLYSNIWLKAESPEKITGGAVCCRSRDGSKTVTFFQQDNLLCISVDGTERWYKPAYDFAMSPYESMRRLYEDFHRYYYPEPLHQLEDITLDDQVQVEALITAYFGALEQKDYAAAWELMSSNRQGKGYPKEPSISEGGRIGDIKLVSMEGYLPPYIARNLPPYEFKMADVPADTPTVWFLVKLDVQSAAGFEWENGINERFVNVAQETDGTWRIDSLATGP